MKRVLHVLATQIEFRMLLVVIVVMVSLSLSSPYFFTASNLYNVMDQSVVTGMVALGQTLVILIGGIDLSVGALAGVTGIVLGLACHAAGLFGGIAACLGVGALAGLINGVIITYGGVAAFVVTLGMMAIGRSMAYVLSGANSISDLPPGLSDISTGTVAGLPVDFACLLAAYALCWLFLTYAKGGRTLYAIGSNVEAARVAGLSIALWSVLAYVVSGVMSGVAAIFLASRILSIDPIGGSGLELDAIAAVVIGGASLVRWPRLDHRHVAGRIYHGVHPQRAEPAERLAVLAGVRDRRHHRRGGIG
jgi:ribose transport system permease protein